MLSEAVFWVFLMVATVAVFTFIAVVTWADQRRREREAYYRLEFRKRLVDAGKMDSEAVANLMRFEYAVEARRLRDKLLIAGFVLLGVGIGLLLGLRFIPDLPVWMVGYIPTLLGAFLLLYGLLFAGKPEPGPPPAGWMPPDGREG